MMNLKKGILQVFLANIINLFFSVCNGFLLPKYLSLETYAGLKTFLLYTSYVGILHFGYVDGVYIRYGGENKEKIYTDGFAYAHRVLVYFQIAVTGIGIAIAVILRDMTLLCAAISILPTNLSAFYKMIYQAVGDFNSYRMILNLTSALIFAANIIFILAGIDNMYGYIGIQLTMTIIIFLYYEYKEGRKGASVNISISVFKTELGKNISSGLIIMLGNFMGVWITGMDRWFVKICGSVADFAYYSFAVTMLKIINTIITAVSITLYHFFCKDQDSARIGSLRKSILIAGAAVIASFYPLKLFISVYLKKYEEAVSIIFIIYAAQYLMTVIHSVYLNLYKSLHRQKKYMIRMVSVTMIAFLLNVFLGKACSYTTDAFALATLLTAVIWLWMCQRDMKEYRMSWREWIYICLAVLGYFIGGLFYPLISLFIYLAWIFILSVLLVPKETKLLFHSIIDILQKKGA